MNNPLSFSSVKLELFSEDGARLKAASGFVIEAGKQHFLITNWHILSGREISGSLQQEALVKPHTLRTSIHVYSRPDEKDYSLFLGNWKKITLSLYDDNHEPKWIEPRPNKQGQPITDIAALPIQLDRTLTMLSGIIGTSNLSLSQRSRVSAISLAAIDVDVEYGPSDPVSVIGYPLNWAPAGSDKSSSAFWRTSSVASEIMERGRPQANLFFIDPCAPEGMTGSPVVGMKNGVTKLLGVYSDASTAEFGANAGMVWEAWRIKELVAAY